MLSRQQSFCSSAVSILMQIDLFFFLNHHAFVETPFPFMKTFILPKVMSKENGPNLQVADSGFQEVIGNCHGKNSPDLLMYVVVQCVFMCLHSIGSQMLEYGRRADGSQDVA